MIISPKLKDRTGTRFGRLTVISHAGSIVSGKQKFSIWLCKCDCGNEITVRGSSLNEKNTQSCGCFHKERLISDATKHGLAKKPFNNCWYGMMSRCNNPKNAAYRFYGKKGIRVCERWHTFENFMQDMLPTWKEGLTLERNKVHEGYNPENCRWATRAEQAINKTNTRWVTHLGKTQSLSVWAREYGIKARCLGSRLNMGWPVERALTEPKRVCNFRIR